MNTDKLLQEIWNNWRHHGGKCNGCPHWASRGCSRPYFGNGDRSADVALIGIEPGTGGDPANPQMDGRPVEEKVDYILDEYPENFDEAQRPLKEMGMYRKHSPGMRKCIDELESGGYSLYYTNVKKCPEENDETLDEAISHCLGYLKDEIESVDPSAMVVFGKLATETLYQLYDISMSSGIIKEALDVRSTESQIIIPSVHFSGRATGYRKQVAKREGYAETDEAYWEALVDVLSTNL